MGGGTEPFKFDPQYISDPLIHHPFVKRFNYPPICGPNMAVGRCVFPFYKSLSSVTGQGYGHCHAFRRQHRYMRHPLLYPSEHRGMIVEYVVYAFSSTIVLWLRNKPWRLSRYDDPFPVSMKMVLSREVNIDIQRTSRTW